MDGGSVTMTRVSPRWENRQTVAGFTSGGPNEVLMAFARRFRGASAQPLCLDIGCGAARNALPLADLGFRVIATDLSAPMVDAARLRVLAAPAPAAVHLVRAPMQPLPFAAGVFDLVVAHGIWNLAGSGADFRSAIAEAARVARPGAGLFLFTFSRSTLPPDAQPDAGESFVYSSWNGEPQCFLDEAGLLGELARAGFVRDGSGPLTEYNAPRPGEIRMGGGPPVIYEGTFVRT
jgi:SAM-dependent methyltransferase